MSDSRNPQTNKQLNSPEIHFEIVNNASTKKLDPRLELIQQGFFGSSADLLPVLAKITDIEAWQQLANIKHGATIRCSDGTGWIVTARIPRSQINDINALPYVKSLEAENPIRPVTNDNAENGSKITNR